MMHDPQRSIRSTFRWRGVGTAVAFVACGCTASIGPGGPSGGGTEEGPGQSVQPSGPGRTGGSTVPGGPSTAAGGTAGNTAPALAAGGGGPAGPMPLRRLSAIEYTNTLRDLFGDGSAGAQLTQGDANHHLYYESDALSVTEIDRYGDAATQIAQTAVANLANLLPCDPKQMGEDACAIHDAAGATNFSLLRRMALTLLQRDDTLKRGVKAKQKKAGWDNDYLLHLLTRGIA